MTFTISGVIGPMRARTLARKRIMSYGYGADDLRMNAYLHKTYGITLRSSAIAIVLKSDWSEARDKNGDKIAVCTITNPKMLYLARLITFGTGRVKGSKILIDSLR